MGIFRPRTLDTRSSIERSVWGCGSLILRILEGLGPPPHVGPTPVSAEAEGRRMSAEVGRTRRHPSNSRLLACPPRFLALLAYEAIEGGIPGRADLDTLK